MKLCHTSAMKLIKELENKKSLLINNENVNSHVSYKEGEEKLLPSYSYNETRTEIKKIDDEIRKIKSLLAKANSTVIIDDFNMNIGEALIYLAQLNREKEQLELLAAYVQKSRRITPNGIIEYTESIYDVNKVKEDIINIRKTINELQIAIDRANLVNYIEL